MDYVCGRNDSNLRYFESKAKVFSVTVDYSTSDSDKHFLEVVGKAIAVDEFASLIKTHIEY